MLDLENCLPDNSASAGVRIIGMLTTTQIANVSGVPGATCTDALNLLNSDIAANTAAIAGKADANLAFVDETASFSISATHRNKVVRVTSASDVTVTVDALAEGNVVGLIQLGAGRVIVANGTCTVSAGASFQKQTLEQNTQIFLQYLTASTALLTGQLDPV